MRPLIAVSSNVPKDSVGKEQSAIEFNYLKCIQDAGGEPVLITPFSDCARMAGMVDGWLITGGADLPPEMYGEPPHSETELMDGRRVAMEQAMFEQFRDSDQPILGICFGMQFLNVIHGGALCQHLPDKLGHTRHTKGESVIRIESDSRLAEIGLPQKFTGRCSHHQAVSRLADGWKAAAYDSEDGCIEAIEQNDGRWRIGVQWHPERTAESEASKTLFRAFVQACSR